MGKIVALSGGIGSGKDTAADYLIRTHGFRKLSFGGPLKDITSILFGWDREMLEGVTPEARAQREEPDTWWSDALDQEITPRNMLQRMGTEVMRESLHNDIWALIIERRIQQNPHLDYVITDARFINECLMLQRLGGKCYGIYRKLPTWLDDFYSYINQKTTYAYGRGLMELDMANAQQVSSLRSAAANFFSTKGLAVHQSEWELYLFNNYNGTIHNTKNLGELYFQLDNLVT